MNRTTSKFIVAYLPLALSIIFASTLALAHAKPPRGGKPPQEAFDACVDKAEGDEISFENRRGDTLEATCQYIENESELVAVPLHHKKREERQ